jgi:precorrin-6B methylase 1
MKGSLIVAGTGIKMVGHVTIETRTLIARSEKVLYLVSDPGTAAWIRQLNPGAESLESCFGDGRTRWESFQRVIEQILEEVHAGKQVCAVFYGHPGVFSHMAHEAIRRARGEGYEATMLPGISAEDCLIADLGVDTGAIGYHCLEASYFLLHGRQPDTASALILWQIGVIGQFHYDFVGSPAEGLKILTTELLKFYPPEHEVVVYEAANFPACDPYIRETALKDLPLCKVSRITTLYVPPARETRPDPEVARKLGLA